ncbi:MAG: hypothetical protein ABEI74_02860 [Candidatus Pacearchaeota archaeon]
MESNENLSGNLKKSVDRNIREISNEHPGKGIGDLGNNYQIREKISEFLENSPIVDLQNYLKKNDVRATHSDKTNHITGKLLPHVKVYEKRDREDRIWGIYYGIPATVFNDSNSPDSLLEYEFAPLSHESLRFYYMENPLIELNYSEIEHGNPRPIITTRELGKMGGESLIKFLYKVNHSTSLISSKTKQSLEKKVGKSQKS